MKAPDETLYTGIFLENLTVEDLKRKIAERYNLDVNAITSLCRISKRGRLSVLMGSPGSYPQH